MIGRETSTQTLPHIRFVATVDFNIGLKREDCPYTTVLDRAAWFDQFDLCVSDHRLQSIEPTEPVNRGTILPFPERPNRSGPND